MGIREENARSLRRAKRWASRAAHAQSKPEIARCARQALDSLYAALPPKRDGTHPLDSLATTERMR